MFKNPNQKTRKLIAAGIVAATVATASPVALAGSVAGNGGATEVTQIMNNAELIESVALNAESVATQAEQLITQANQYSTMLQNLRQLPATAMSKILAGLPSDVQRYAKLFKVATDLQTSATQAARVLTGAVDAAGRMKIDPSEYANQMLGAAQSRGGYWQQAVQHDMAALNEAQARGQAFIDYQRQVGDIDGNVSGMQTLANGSSLMISELRDMRDYVVRQAQERAGQGAIDEAEKARQLAVLKAHAAAVDDAVTRSTATAAKTGK